MNTVGRFLTWGVYAALLLAVAIPCQAQRVKQSTQGYAKQRDGGEREPLLSTEYPQTFQAGETFEVFAHISTDNDVLALSSLIAEFYVNGNLYARQINLPDSPKWGVKIGPAQHNNQTVNVTITANIASANRTFRTRQDIVIFLGQGLLATLDCNYIADATDEEAFDGDALDVEFSQTSSTTSIANFTAEDSVLDEDADIDLALTINGTDVSGTLTITHNSNTTTTRITGTATFDDSDQLTAISATGDTDNSSLECS